MIFAFSFEGCPLVIACFWTSFTYFGAEKFSPKTAYFSSIKYEQGSQTLSFKVGENLAQIRAKEFPKEGNLSTILEKATTFAIGAKIDPRGVGKKW